MQVGILEQACLAVAMVANIDLDALWLLAHHMDLATIHVFPLPPLPPFPPVGVDIVPPPHAQQALSALTPWALALLASVPQEDSQPFPILPSLVQEAELA